MLNQLNGIKFKLPNQFLKGKVPTIEIRRFVLNVLCDTFGN